MIQTVQNYMHVRGKGGVGAKLFEKTTSCRASVPLVVFFAERLVSPRRQSVIKTPAYLIH